MEMASVKSEVSVGRRHIAMAEGEAKVVKRRRRDTSAVAAAAALDQQGPESSQPPPAATTVKRSSRFRGVSRHRWTGRFEAHLWDKGSWNPTQRKKGKQVYLGAYDEEEAAARAYDLAALKYWGTSTFTNFPVSDYEKEIDIMQTVTKEEYLASLRRRSSGFSRGVSRYRGVARHHHNGRWEARIGRVFGNKYLYLGTYGTQEEAAHAYDIAAIEYRGINAVTNFDLSKYIRWLKPPQEPQHHTIVSQPHSLPPSSSNYIQTEDQTQLPLLHAGDPIPITPTPCTNSSSSPTALGLLFRSSVFRELVGRNLNAAEEETDEINPKGLPLTRLPYEELGGYICPTNDVLPGLEAQEDSTLPMYNRAQGSLWNAPLTMSSSIN